MTNDQWWRRWGGGGGVEFGLRVACLSSKLAGVKTNKTAEGANPLTGEWGKFMAPRSHPRILATGRVSLIASKCLWR